jgi:hypothetical protein
MFQNDSFDRYIANLSLHIVTNPSDMIKEVLKSLIKGFQGTIK